MLERRAHFLREFDWIRTGLMFEPRGHDMMSGSILYPPTRADCDVAVLFIETSGCLPMCGHGTIGTITMAIENGLITPREPGHLSIEAPAGIDWLCVSPKAGAPLLQTRGQELKLVWPQPGLDPEELGRLDFEHFLLQPMDNPAQADNTQACIAYCQAHPQWRLSLQTHKILEIR